MPLWAAQGERFEHQSNLWAKARQDDQIRMSPSQAKDFLEPESQSLERRYRPGCKDSPILRHHSDRSGNHRRILERCREFDNLNFASTQLQEEQERELTPETEQERQVQRPPPATPAKHNLHADLRSFVSTGILKKPSIAYKSAFEALRNTTAASHLDVSQFPSGLLVTNDFATTVQVSKGSHSMDVYQRPVQWVLTSSCTDGSSGRKIARHMIIVSPYEASHLLPEIRNSKKVAIHLYAPRQNLSFSSLDRLRLYNVPAGSDGIGIPDPLKIQLNLFSGQLYVGSYSEYRELCDFLGVASVKTPEGLTVAADGFIVGGNQARKTTFSQSPLKFLKVLMSQIRKECQEISKTHVGKILDGRLLGLSDFPSPTETTTALSLRTRTN